MNRYQKDIKTIRNRHNRIVAFSKKIQEAMGLTNEDARWAFRNNVSWRLLNTFYEIKCSYSQKTDVFIVDETRDGINTPPPEAKQKEILKLIKANK